jgi:hypothetical protein
VPAPSNPLWTTAQSPQAHTLRLCRARALLDQFAENALRSEIENIAINRSSEEDDYGWLISIEQMAERIGIAQSLESEIRIERDTIFDHYAEGAEEDEDPSPTSGRGYSGPSDTHPAGEQRSQIGAMFQELS